jgi:hypothetical protein
MVLAISTLAASTSMGGNLIINGDFEMGNTGFSSGYDYNDFAFPSCRYSITTSPRNNHPWYADYHDHTTGTGNMLLANGHLEPYVAVWEQTVAVIPNTNYEFSFWVSTANEADPSINNQADLEYYINDEYYIGSITAPAQYGQWIQATATWNSEYNTTATIKIIDMDTEEYGNDFAIDDIRFVPEPATILLLGIGAAILRKRQ